MKYQLSRLIIGPGLHLLARTEIVGADNVPATGGAILASNHVSILDSFYLPLLLERPDASQPGEVCPGVDRAPSRASRPREQPARLVEPHRVDAQPRRPRQLLHPIFHVITL